LASVFLWRDRRSRRLDLCLLLDGLGFDDHELRPDSDLVADLAVDGDDRAGNRRGQLDDRLFGRHIDERLILFDPISGLRRAISRSRPRPILARVGQLEDVAAHRSNLHLLRLGALFNQGVAAEATTDTSACGSSVLIAAASAPTRRATSAMLNAGSNASSISTKVIRPERRVRSV
jgi:hypothetical protein